MKRKTYISNTVLLLAWGALNKFEAHLRREISENQRVLIKTAKMIVGRNKIHRSIRNDAAHYLKTHE